MPDPSPAFSIAAAEAMIRAGQAPPETWRPRITHLAFGRTGWNADGSLDHRITPPPFDPHIDPRLLAGLPNLQRLSLDGMAITDLAPLATLRALRVLDLDNTDVRDLTPLAALPALEYLYLSNTLVRDLSPLASLTTLQGLYLSNTQIRDLAPLASLHALRELYAPNTAITTLTPIRDLPALQTLTLTGSKVTQAERQAFTTHRTRHNLPTPRL